MTRFISVRSKNVGGPVVQAFCVESQGGPDPTYATIDDARVAADVTGKQAIIAIHGFNVSRAKAVRSYVTLEAELQLTADQVFFGVLWPGDYWLPVVNYPAESSDAIKSGQFLAAYLNARFARTTSINLISHSLGGRVLLQAVRDMSRGTQEACVTAGAIDNDCLHAEYLAAKQKAHRVSVLASRKDKVLKLAYPLGDFVTDVFLGGHDSPWHGALGLKGPHPFEPPPAVSHRQIADNLDYGHGDYFPPSEPGGTRNLWKASVAYMRRCVNGAPDSW